ncbi:MAG: hypothetical protein KC621_10465 [Myxococcales bacterium]|nr:hypothetical protein [Myxococcales bacterium]
MQPIPTPECDEDEPTVQMSDDQRRQLIATFTPATLDRRSPTDLESSLDAQFVPVTPVRISHPGRPSLGGWAMVVASGVLVALSLLGGAAILQIW